MCYNLYYRLHYKGNQLLTRDTHLMQQFIYYYKQLHVWGIYMPIFRSIRLYTYYATPYGVQH